MAVAPGNVDFATLSQFVKDHLAKAPSEILKPHWDTIINQGLVAGYWTVVNAWIYRGYTKAQVDQWDRLDEYQLEIAAWFCLKRLSALQPDGVSQAQLDALDRRPELVNPPKDGMVSAVLTINGEAVEGEGDFGQPTYGPVDTTNDMFITPKTNRDDSRIGEITRL